MSANTSRWHQTVKLVLKNIGSQRGFDVSESEAEFIFPAKFQQFIGDRRKIHTIICKPDVVWKKSYKYRAIFEVEYSSAIEESRFLEKKKYCIGSLMQAILFMYNKTADYAVFITNSEQLHESMKTFLKLISIRDDQNIIILYEPNRGRSTITRNLSRALNQAHVLPKNRTPRRILAATQPTPTTQPT